MATSPDEFIELAAELIGDEFAEFAISTTITKSQSGGYNTAPTTTTTTIPTIMLEFKASQFNGELVKVGDYMLIGEYQELDFEPSPDNCETSRDGATCEVKAVYVDPAKATVTMHVRPT
jgi:hypothetical protein